MLVSINDHIKIKPCFLRLTVVIHRGCYSQLDIVVQESRYSQELRPAARKACRDAVEPWEPSEHPVGTTRQAPESGHQHNDIAGFTTPSAYYSWIETILIDELVLCARWY